MTPNRGRTIDNKGKEKGEKLMKRIMILITAMGFLLAGAFRLEAAEKKITIALSIKTVNYSSIKASIIPEMIYSRYSGNKSVNMIAISQVKEQISRMGIDENNPDAVKLQELGRALKAEKLVFVNVAKAGGGFDISEKSFDVDSADFSIEDKATGVPESRVVDSVRSMFDSVVGKIVTETANNRKEEQVKPVVKPAVKPVEKETVTAPVKDAAQTPTPTKDAVQTPVKDAVQTPTKDAVKAESAPRFVIKKTAEPGASVSKIAIGLLGYDILRNDFSFSINTYGLSVKLFATGNAFAFEGKLIGTYDNEFQNIGTEANILYHFLLPNGGPYLGAGIIVNYNLPVSSVKIAGLLKGGCSIPLGPIELFGEGGADKGILFETSATGLSRLNIFGNAGFRVVF